MSTPEPTHEMVEAFRAAWDKADIGGSRERTRIALRAALAVAPAPSDDDREALEHLFRSEFKASKIMGQMMANAVLSMGFHSQPKLTDPSSEGYPEFEEWEQLLFQHRPVISMHDGGIAGCACLDRVFVKKSEDWGTHLAQVVMDILARRSPVSPPEDVTALIADLRKLAVLEHMDEEGNPVQYGEHPTLMAAADALAALRAPVPVETVTTVEELPVGSVFIGHYYSPRYGPSSLRKLASMQFTRGRSIIYGERCEYPLTHPFERVEVLFRPTREEEW